MKAVLTEETHDAGQISENDFLKMNFGRNYEFKQKLLVHDFKTLGWPDPWKNQAFKLTKNQEEIELLLKKKGQEDEKNEKSNYKEYSMQFKTKDYG